jgi:DNA-binding transcriptional regulator YiaG
MPRRKGDVTLPSTIIRQIRALRELGMTQHEIAAAVGVSQPTVCKHTWDMPPVVPGWGRPRKVA